MFKISKFIVICGPLAQFVKSIVFPCDKWVPVARAWHVLKLLVEERPPIWTVAANILNKRVWKPEGKRPLGRPRCRWEDNNKMYLQEVGCVDMDWVGLAQVRDMSWALVNAVMNLQFP
jgi:hypothetical protein